MIIELKTDLMHGYSKSVTKQTCQCKRSTVILDKEAKKCRYIVM